MVCPRNMCMDTLHKGDNDIIIIIIIIIIMVIMVILGTAHILRKVLM